MRNLIQRNKVLIASLCGIVGLYIFLYSAFDQTLLSHNGHDSHTLHALAWWEGRTSLKQNYPSLELAFYKDQVFVSFPPFPAVIQFIFLIPVFGENTPSNLLSTTYTILSYLFTFFLCRNRGFSENQSLFWSLFLIFGSNLLAISSNGGVWFQSQSLAFLLCTLSIYFLSLKKQIYWYFSFAFLAFAVGCRPFDIVFFSVLLFLLFRNIQEPESKISWMKILQRCCTFLIAPAVIGALYALYNYARFDDPLEFGHNYLPEHVNSVYGQFSLRYFPKNFSNVLRLPFNSQGEIEFPLFGGFAFYIANPIFIVFLIRLVKAYAGIFFQFSKSHLKSTKSYVRLAVLLRRTTRFSFNFIHLVIPLCILINLFLTLCHASLGGWQFGIRYFVDCLPFVFLYIIETVGKTVGTNRIYLYQILLMIFAIELNLYGTLWMFLNWSLDS